MIVRDEQEMLPGLLESVRGLWDEFIVADTGSTDGSTDLLEAAGATVVPFTWCDDFAAARNASVAPATGRWILFLDADERVTPDLARQIRALVDDPHAGAATVVMRNELADGNIRESRLLRLFRNDPAIRFRYRIHEDISEPVRDFLQARGLAMRHLDGKVNHLGYSRAVAGAKDKKARDLALLRRSLDEHPDDFYCWFKLMEIARFWSDAQLWIDTGHELRTRLEALPGAQAADLKQRPWSGDLAAMVCWIQPWEPEQKLDWLEKSARFATPSPAWLLERGLRLEQLNRRDEARAAYAACLDHPGGETSQNTTVRPLLGLCRLAVADGNLPEAWIHTRRALDLNPADREALFAACTFAPGDEDWATPHAADHPAALLPLVETLVQTRQVDLADRLLTRHGTDTPETLLGQLTLALAYGRDIALDLAVDQATADRIFRRWVGLLWQSRQPHLLENFADNCGVVLEVFPWLPDFLQEETRRMQG